MISHRNSNLSPDVDVTEMYSPADLSQDAEWRQQQEDGAGATTEWPQRKHGQSGHVGTALGR
jgi:hypothetical protein